MNNYPKRIRKMIVGIIIITIILSIGFMIKGFLCRFGDCEYIDKQQAIIGIIVPMICALVGVCIPIAMDNSLSNEKLKISLNRLEWWWKYHCKDESGKIKSGYESLDFDIEYKFIFKNRGKSHKKLFKLMQDDLYRSEKYSIERKVNKINKTEKIFLKDWIEDHFIY